uniref:Uncharacterized protein n=1 Tax=Strigamia maritima TaxID=126957 RepID=T1INB4_STRMM
MEPELLERALNFHGNDLLRSMAKFCGMDILTLVDPRQVTYSDFHKRYKDPKLEDGAKRCRILEFICRKAHMLFKKPKQRTSMMLLDLDDDDNYAVMPPLEAFMGVPEKERHKHFLECLRKGDIVIGIIHAKQAIGFILKLLCVDAGPIREIYDLDIKALCPINQAVAVSAHESPIDTYQIKDLIRCSVVLEVVPEEEKIIISMKSDCNPTHAKMKLGLISEENLPPNFRKTTKLHGAMYETVLEHSTGFMNPSNVPYICDIMGLNKDRPSLMSGLHEKEYVKEEYAISLRKEQAAKWALQSVADGISHFKAGRHTEAFQCLNKALQIDPENVEALVARGALFANNCNFTRALEDFELAIEINPKHHNARKYMVETLVALGRQHEDKSDNKMAYKLFYKALQFNPDHREANEAIRLLEVKEKANLKAKQEREVQVVEVKSVKKEANEPSSSNTREKLKQLLKKEKQKKVKNVETKHRGRSSSSSSTSSSGSSSGSTSSRSPSPRSKSKRRSPVKMNSNDRFQEKKILPRGYRLNVKEERTIKEERSGKNRIEEKPGLKKNEIFLALSGKMQFDKGKDFTHVSQFIPTSETTATSGLEFEDLEARLSSYYKKFDTTISDDSDVKGSKRQGDIYFLFFYFKHN